MVIFQIWQQQQQQFRLDSGTDAILPADKEVVALTDPHALTQHASISARLPLLRRVWNEQAMSGSSTEDGSLNRTADQAVVAVACVASCAARLVLYDN